MVNQQGIIPGVSLITGVLGVGRDNAGGRPHVALAEALTAPL